MGSGVVQTAESQKEIHPNHQTNTIPIEWRTSHLRALSSALLSIRTTGSPVITPFFVFLLNSQSNSLLNSSFNLNAISRVYLFVWCSCFAIGTRDGFKIFDTNTGRLRYERCNFNSIKFNFVCLSLF